MGQVTYLKALYGFGGEPVICGPRQNAKSWKRMAANIAYDDWIAIYIPAKSGETKYHGRISAFIQIAPLHGKSVQYYGQQCLSYGWNKNQWPVGVPARNWYRIPLDQAPVLKDIMIGLGHFSDWDSMKASLRNGPIDLRSKYPYLVSELTILYTQVQHQLIPC